MQQDHGSRFLKGIIDAKEPRYWLVAAVLATFVSSALYDAVTVGIGERRWSYFLIRVGFALVLSLVFLYLLPVALRMARQGQDASALEIAQRSQVKRPLVLIVYVSAPPPGAPKRALHDSHAAVVQHFLNQPRNSETPVITLYLIHSPDSREIAADYSAFVNETPDLRIAANWAGLGADFFDLESVYAATRKAIDLGLTQSSAGDILLDLTGGTKLATSGGFLAGMETGITLSYLQQPKGLQVLDITWYNQRPPVFRE